MNEIIPGDYSGLLGEIKERIRAAPYEALRATGRELIALYWDIGRLIVERQAGDSWRTAVGKSRARNLQAESPGAQRFSARNIRRMRDFYSSYRDNEKLQPLVAEIGWSHNLVILTRCKDDAEREFYLRLTRAHGWTKNVLIHQIENRTYEKSSTARRTSSRRYRLRCGRRRSWRSRTRSTRYRREKACALAAGDLMYVKSSQALPDCCRHPDDA